MATAKKNKKPALGAERSATQKVKVLTDNFGVHKKGDTLMMHPSTAKACAAHKQVELVK